MSCLTIEIGLPSYTRMFVFLSLILKMYIEQKTLKQFCFSLKVQSNTNAHTVFPKNWFHMSYNMFPNFPRELISYAINMFPIKRFVSSAKHL